MPLFLFGGDMTRIRVGLEEWILPIELTNILVSLMVVTPNFVVGFTANAMEICYGYISEEIENKFRAIFEAEDCVISISIERENQTA